MVNKEGPPTHPLMTTIVYVPFTRMAARISATEWLLLWQPVGAVLTVYGLSVGARMTWRTTHLSLLLRDALCGGSSCVVCYAL
jgi:hypothetical protein